MNTVPNQKVITTKGALHDKDNIYAMLNIEALNLAMMTLSPNTFKLWCYMAKNQNDYTFALSSTDVCKVCSMSIGTYKKAVNELIDSGYLVNTSGNSYNFYEMLPEAEVINVTVKKS